MSKLIIFSDVHPNNWENKNSFASLKVSLDLAKSGGVIDDWMIFHQHNADKKNPIQNFSNTELYFLFLSEGLFFSPRTVLEFFLTDLEHSFQFLIGKVLPEDIDSFNKPITHLFGRINQEIQENLFQNEIFIPSLFFLKILPFSFHESTNIGFCRTAKLFNSKYSFVPQDNL